MQYLPRSSRFGRRRKGVNTKKLGTIIFLVVLLVIIGCCAHFYSLYAALQKSSAPAIWRPETGERLQFVLLGHLNNTISSCTLLSVPKDQDSPISILRVPPATLLGSNSGGNVSLAETYAEHGIETTLRGLEALLGNKLPIHHHVIYDVHGIENIVSNFGKLVITLPEEIKTQHENIDRIFAQGNNDLSANDVQFLIASDSNQESKYFWAEKTLLVDVFNGLFTLNHISYFIRNKNDIAGYYETDLTTRQFARFRDTLQALQEKDSIYSVLPGRWLVSEGKRYWSCQPEHLQVIVKQIEDNIPGYDKSSLKVDLFNGNGIKGFAATTAEGLRDCSFNVDKLENAKITSSTIIYYQEEYLLAAIEISLHLGVEAELIQDRYYDSDNPVAVILGLDLAGR